MACLGRCWSQRSRPPPDGEGLRQRISSHIWCCVLGWLGRQLPGAWEIPEHGRNCGLFRCAMPSISSLGWVDSFRNGSCGGGLSSRGKKDNIFPRKEGGPLKKGPP